MQIVIGHKNLNLEELFTISGLHLTSEVVIDNVIACEFNTQHKLPENKLLQEGPQFPHLNSTLEDERAILLVKILQLIKLKKHATKHTVEYLVRLLNSHHI